MAQPAVTIQHARIGDFLVDLRSGDVIGPDTRARLQLQSLELLRALLEQPGQMVSRDELRRRLWPTDTFVDFDHGLNAAVRRLRETLGDSAEAPRFIETIPRRGYRLIATTAEVAAAAPPAPAARAPEPGGPVPVRAPGVEEPAPAAMPARTASTSRGRLALIAALSIGAIAAAAGWLQRAKAPPAAVPPTTAFEIDVPPGWSLRAGDHLAVSPDSHQLAFTAQGPDGSSQLWVRPLTSFELRAIPGTTGALAPFWSPDGARIGFFDEGQLKSVTLADGSVRVLGFSAPPPIVGGSGAWTADGDILFMPLSTGMGTTVRAARLRRRDATTGATDFVTTTTPQPSAIIDLLAPVAVPGREAFSFVRWDLATVRLSGHATDLRRSRVVDLGRTDSRVVVTSSGHALYVRDRALVAQPFDLTAWQSTGAAAPIAADVAVSHPMLGHFSATADVVVYLPASAPLGGTSLTIVDRAGARRRIGDIADYTGVRVSPDGTRVAVARRDPRLGTRDVWIYDLGDRPPVRVTFDRHDDLSPAWSSDGRSLLFASDRAGERDLYRKDLAGPHAEVRAFASGDSKSLNAWSPDGRLFVYDTGARGSIDAQGRNNKDLLVGSLDGGGSARPIATTPAAEWNADISPDGAWVAYEVGEGDGSNVVVEAFPDKGARFQVTTTGGREPMWRSDGRELYFVSARRELCAVAVRIVDGAPRFGAPVVLFPLPPLPDMARHYSPLPGGQAFVLIADERPETPQRLRALVNWRSSLPR